MKRRILFLSNFSLANSGFGKSQKNILSRLYKTGKYELCELAAGISDSDPNCTRVPWRVIGILPKNHEEAARFGAVNPDQQRAFQYGLFRFEEAVTKFKPDIVIVHEDIWASSGWIKQLPSWGKYKLVCWCPLDAEPLSEEFAAFLKDIPVLTYSKWSVGVGKAAGLENVKHLTLGVDTDTFRPLGKSESLAIRNRFGIAPDDYIVLMVARNQIRKKFDVLFEAVNEIGKLNPEVYKRLKVIPFTHFTDPAGVLPPKFWRSRKVDENKFLIPYFCDNCRSYHVAKKYEGDDKKCPSCGADKSCHTPSVTSGLTDEQLNEIYNISDLFVLPTSNEGMGVPVLEAKASGKVTIATEYSSSGEVTLGNNSGFAFDYVLYNEHGTLFKKAHLTPFEVAKKIIKAYNLKSDQRQKMEKAARELVLEEYNWDTIVQHLESELDAIKLLENVEWEPKQQVKNPNPHAEIPQCTTDVEWLLALYKNILDTNILEETGGKPLENDGIKYWLQEMLQGRRTKVDIENFFRSTATQDLKKKEVLVDSVLDPLDSKRLLFVMRESAGDNFLCTAIVASLKEKYPEHVIYVSSKPEFAGIWKNNPDVKRWIPFSEVMYTYGWGVDRFNKGPFDIVLTPAITTQLTNNPNWHHNGKTQSHIL